MYGLADMPLMVAARRMTKTATFQEHGFAWGYLLTEGTMMGETDIAGYYLRGDKDRFEALTRLVRNERDGREPMTQFHDEDLEHTQKVKIASTNLRLTFGVYHKRLRGAYISIEGSGEHEVAPLIIARRVLEEPRSAIGNTNGNGGMAWRP